MKQPELLISALSVVTILSLLSFPLALEGCNIACRVTPRIGRMVVSVKLAIISNNVAALSETRKKLLFGSPSEDGASPCGAFFCKNCDSNGFACAFQLLMSWSHIPDSQVEWWEGVVTSPLQFLFSFESDFLLAVLKLDRQQKFSEIFCETCEVDLVRLESKTTSNQLLIVRSRK